MKITKHDIGAEVISILTRGMYPDPRDALREYVQNAVDAKSINIQIKIRHNSIVVIDDGVGMDEKTLRKAIRVGISDKNPNKDVGFMGIGIYSAFHLCNKLNIYTRTHSGFPLLLSFNFQKMRDILDSQKNLQSNEEIDSDDLIDLQSLLEDSIEFKKLKDSDYVNIGTRIEIMELDPIFYKSLSDFEDVSEYLQLTIPLHFDENNFKWAKEIEKQIKRISKKNNAEFQLVHLNLQVNNRKEDLFRPYINDEFFNSDPRKPKFIEIKKDGLFFGVAWGCLNNARKKITDSELRGFILKKQGFSIGTRKNLIKYFGRNTYFDRWMGEIIITHNKLLPNAARNDLQYSDLRDLFYESLSDVASEFNEEAHDFQEFSLGDEQIDEAAIELNELNKSFSSFSENPDELLNILVKIRNTANKIERRIDRHSVREERIKDANKIIKLSRDLEESIRYRIEFISKEKRKYSKKEKEKPKKISSKLNKMNINEVQLKEYESLKELLDELDLELNDEWIKVIDLLDDKFISGSTKTKNEYKEVLQNLKIELEELFNN